MIRLTRKKLLIAGASLFVATALSLGVVTYARASRVISSVTTTAQVTSVLSLLKTEPLDGESTGTVNVLIAGNSSDDPGHSGALLTDSLMVASYNLTTKKMTLVSIPRDLWVTYGGSSSKINAVFASSGIDALKSVVTEVTGLTINHYALINYTAFQSMIDAVGGVDVTVASSDARGIYDPMTNFSITNGVHHLDGATALALSRARNDPTYDGRIAYGLPNGDFDRAQYQRLIAEALMQKIAQSVSLSNIGTLSKIVSSLSNNVTSDFSAGQLRRAYSLSKSVTSTASISIRGDDTTTLIGDYYVGGQAALVPSAGYENYTAIQTYIASTITPPAAATKTTASNT